MRKKDTTYGYLSNFTNLIYATSYDASGKIPVPLASKDTGIEAMTNSPKGQDSCMVQRRFNNGRFRSARRIPTSIIHIISVVISMMSQNPEGKPSIPKK